MKDYKKILESIVDIIHTTEKSDIGFTNICAYIGENCSELKNFDDERLRKTTISFLKEFADKGYENAVECIDWLESQRQPFTKKDVDDAWLKGMCDAKHELEKQSEQNKPSISDEIEHCFKEQLMSWHSVDEGPKEGREILCEWESDDATWHDVAFYHANTKTFWRGHNQIENVVRWIYVDDLIKIKFCDGRMPLHPENDVLLKA